MRGCKLSCWCYAAAEQKRAVFDRSHGHALFRQAGNGSQTRTALLAQAGEGNGRTRQRFAHSPATSRFFSHAGNAGRAGPQIERLGVVQHRHHQPHRGLRRNAQVHGGVLCQHAGLIVKTRVDLRKIAQRQHHGAHQKRQ